MKKIVGAYRGRFVTEAEAKAYNLYCDMYFLPISRVNKFIDLEKVRTLEDDIEDELVNWVWSCYREQSKAY